MFLVVDTRAGGCDGRWHARRTVGVMVTAPGFADTADKFALTSQY